MIETMNDEEEMVLRKEDEERKGDEEERKHGCPISFCGRPFLFAFHHSP